MKRKKSNSSLEDLNNDLWHSDILYLSESSGVNKKLPDNIINSFKKEKFSEELPDEVYKLLIE